MECESQSRECEFAASGSNNGQRAACGVRRAAMKIEAAQRGKRAEGAAGTADEFGVRLSGWCQM